MDKNYKTKRRLEVFGFLAVVVLALGVLSTIVLGMTFLQVSFVQAAFLAGYVLGRGGRPLFGG